MVPVLLLSLLWGGSLQEQPGYELQVQESVTVQEGLCVHVPCSFSYPRSSSYASSELFLYWYRNGDNTDSDAPVVTNNPKKPVLRGTMGRFLFVDPRNNNCSLSIRDARISDTGIYFFRMEKKDYVKYSYLEKKLNLQVAALTEKPTIHIPEPLESGRPTQLTCSLPGSCEGERLLTFSWVGDAVDSVNPQTLHSSSVLNLTLRPRDHGTTLICQVKHQRSLVTTQRTIQLNVSYAPRNLRIGMSIGNVTGHKILQNTSSLHILEGEALRLLCVADSNPPAQLSWFRGSPALNATPISSTVILELPRVGTAEEDKFACQAQNLLGSQNVTLNLFLLYPPQLLGPSCSWESKDLHCSCSSRAQPAPSLRWRLGERLLEGNLSHASGTVTSHLAGPWANSSLSLSKGLSAGLRLSCEARNAHGFQSDTVLLLPGKSVSLADVVPAGLGGAGVMALLSLSLCLIIFCIVRVYKKPAARVPKVMTDEEPVMGTVTWCSQQKPRPGRPPEQVSHAKSTLSWEQQEVYYGNLSFHKVK